MKRLVLLAAGLVACAAPAWADVRLEPAFTGVIVSTYPDGRTARLWLGRDGTYQAEGRRRKPSSGTWKVVGEKICLRQRRPFPGPFNYCQPIPAGPVWRGEAPTGEPIELRLTAGGRR